MFRVSFGFSRRTLTMLHGLKPLPRVEAPEPMNIELTEVETQVCNILEKFTAHLKDTKGVSTSCRIAGGWVRDKVHTARPQRPYFQ